MPLESPTVPVTPDQLNGNWPIPEDPKSAGDDHIRITKQALITFWDKVNFAGLEQGAIPVYFNGKFIDAGLTFSGGAALFGRPLVAPQFIQNGGLNPEARQLIGIKTTDSGVLRPDVPSTGSLVELPIQILEDTVNVAPVLFSFLQDSDALVKGVIVKATTVVNRVRFTLRDTNAAGPILYQTATDAELEAGGGASLLAGVESSVLFPQKLEMFAGRTIHVTVERFDIDTNSIVTTGISLKGTVISTVFIPYQKSIRQAITRRQLQVKGDAPCLAYMADSSVQTLSSTPVNVGSFTFNNAEGPVDVIIEAGVFIAGIPNATVTINVTIDSVLVDSGSGFTARVNNSSVGMAFPINALIPKTFAAGAHTIVVSAFLSTGAASKSVARVTVNRKDAGNVWA